MAGTVADQIKALGYDPSYSGRSSLYSQFKLPGAFTGTAAQNVALLGAAQKAKGGGSNTGIAAPAPSAPTDLQSLVTQQNQQRDALLAKQNEQQQGLFGQYTGAIGGQEKLGTAYDRMSADAGLPDIKNQIGIFKGQIYNVKGLLDKLTEDINSRVSGSFTTQAQADRLQAKEGADLNTQLGRLGTGLQPLVDQLGSSQQDISTRLGFLQADQATALKPLELQINSLSDRFSRELTGFSQDKESELGALTDKITRERQLSDREWTRINDLSKQEREYSLKKQQAADELNARNKMLIENGFNPVTGLQTNIGGSNMGATSLKSLGINGAANVFQKAGLSKDEMFKAFQEAGFDMGQVKNIFGGP